MTESEKLENAIAILEAMKKQFLGETRNVIDVAINALEKQIPKMPTYDGDGYAPDGTFIWDEWICPCCGRRYEADYDDYDYCPDCGQKLDWSDEE